MMVIPLRFVIVIAAVLALIVSSSLPSVAQQSARAKSASPYELSAILSLTGPAAFLGTSEAKALRVIEALTNESGGIHGHPLRFTILDDETNPEIAVQLVNGLIAKKPTVFLGPGLSSTCSAIAPLTQIAGPTSYCYSPAIHPPKGSFQFSASVSTVDLVAMFVRYFRLNGWTRFAILDATDATGHDFDGLIGPALALPANKGMTIVGHEHFANSDVSVAAQVAKLATAKPQAIVVWTTGTGLGTALRGIHDIGLNIPVLTVAGNMVRGQLQQYASFIPKELLFTGLRSAATGPGHSSKAMDHYKSALKAVGVRPDFGTNIAWDPTMIVIDALRALGSSATSTQVRDWVESLHNWTGIDGSYDFRDGNQRGIGQNATVIYRWKPASNDFVAASRPAGFLLR